MTPPLITSARKEKDNEYSFTLPLAMHFRVVFAIGIYSYEINCIDNRHSQANELYTFNILLQKEKFNPASLKFIRPCMLGDDGE